MDLTSILTQLIPMNAGIQTEVGIPDNSINSLNGEFIELFNELSIDINNGYNKSLEEEGSDKDVKDNEIPASNNNLNNLTSMGLSHTIISNNEQTGNNITEGFDKINEIGEKKIDSVQYLLESDGHLVKTTDNLNEYFLKKDTVFDKEDKLAKILQDTVTPNASLYINEDDTSLFGQPNNKKSNDTNNNDYFILNNESIKEGEINNNSQNNSLPDRTTVTDKDILKQIKDGIKSSSTSHSMQIMLKPQSLGKVNLNVKFYNNALHLDVFVENSLTQEVLEKNIGAVLGQIATSDLVKIDRISIKKISDIFDDDNCFKPSSIVKKGRTIPVTGISNIKK